uniref:Uncharacterized protein n=1 Tax=Chromera velia CCMP2878 TaxID=1169474 RepID=A0A0G4G1M4_9ALVE|eukprot:Cvel_19827.t1-p1 / transcript=Cvel_19827.t1 / gene=Cvel_19827 / organism=Chromera_velia_CCMP2878 / gene_product=Putative mediator of RNA polymerase II, putative / transcript_product=Putative mediator of RNA polymerase II, putative / location=Cvel_scaffold1735:32922-37013(-) / protein_length=1013 / sequence_SO=supercontig / SO=protein_coding / is_pseudo=false
MLAKQQAITIERMNEEMSILRDALEAALTDKGDLERQLEEMREEKEALEKLVEAADDFIQMSRVINQRCSAVIITAAEVALDTSRRNTMTLSGMLSSESLEDSPDPSPVVNLRRRTEPAPVLAKVDPVTITKAPLNKSEAAVQVQFSPLVSDAGNGRTAEGGIQTQTDREPPTEKSPKREEPPPSSPPKPPPEHPPEPSRYPSSSWQPVGAHPVVLPSIRLPPIVSHHSVVSLSAQPQHTAISRTAVAQPIASTPSGPVVGLRRNSETSQQPVRATGAGTFIRIESGRPSVVGDQAGIATIFQQMQSQREQGGENTQTSRQEKTSTQSKGRAFVDFPSRKNSTDGPAQSCPPPPPGSEAPEGAHPLGIHFSLQMMASPRSEDALPLSAREAADRRASTNLREMPIDEEEGIGGQRRQTSSDSVLPLFGPDGAVALRPRLEGGPLPVRNPQPATEGEIAAGADEASGAQGCDPTTPDDKTSSEQQKATQDPQGPQHAEEQTKKPAVRGKYSQSHLKSKTERKTTSAKAKQGVQRGTKTPKPGQKSNTSVSAAPSAKAKMSVPGAKAKAKVRATPKTTGTPAAGFSKSVQRTATLPQSLHPKSPRAAGSGTKSSAFVKADGAEETAVSQKLQIPIENGKIERQTTDECLARAVHAAHTVMPLRFVSCSPAPFAQTFQPQRHAHPIVSPTLKAGTSKSLQAGEERKKPTRRSQSLTREKLNLSLSGCTLPDEAVLGPIHTTQPPPGVSTPRARLALSRKTGFQSAGEIRTNSRGKPLKPTNPNASSVIVSTSKQLSRGHTAKPGVSSPTQEAEFKKGILHLTLFDPPARNHAVPLVPVGFSLPSPTTSPHRCTSTASATRHFSSPPAVHATMPVVRAGPFTPSPVPLQPTRLPPSPPPPVPRPLYPVAKLSVQRITPSPIPLSRASPLPAGAVSPWRPPLMYAVPRRFVPVCLPTAVPPAPSHFPVSSPPPGGRPRAQPLQPLTGASAEDAGRGQNPNAASISKGSTEMERPCCSL